MSAGAPGAHDDDALVRDTHGTPSSAYRPIPLLVF